MNYNIFITMVIFRKNKNILNKDIRIFSSIYREASRQI
uniref:Uncharacterized protein n=1 Tax=viral metagenome TaxID=1070528 RepID=A0A6C0K6U9_9ZZZZ